MRTPLYGGFVNIDEHEIRTRSQPASIVEPTLVRIELELVYEHRTNVLLNLMFVKQTPFIITEFSPFNGGGRNPNTLSLILSESHPQALPDHIFNQINELQKGFEKLKKGARMHI